MRALLCRAACMVTVTVWQALERWDQTRLENVSGKGWALLTDLEQKPPWQVVSGTYERASDWRGIGEPSRLQREALISWRAIGVNRVLNIMKHCTVKLRHRPGGFSLTKRFPLSLTTLIWQLFAAAVLSHSTNPCINLFTLIKTVDVLKKKVGQPW